MSSPAATHTEALSSASIFHRVQVEASFSTKNNHHVHMVNPATRKSTIMQDGCIWGEKFSFKILTVLQTAACKMYLHSVLAFITFLLASNGFKNALEATDEYISIGYGSCW